MKSGKIPRNATYERIRNDEPDCNTAPKYDKTLTNESDALITIINGISLCFFERQIFLQFSLRKKINMHQFNNMKTPFNPIDLS